MMILGLVLALLVGLAMGLLGAGGSILTIPIFVYVVGFDIKQSIAMSLAVVGVTSVVGAIRHGRSGNVNLRVALIFAPVAMLGTYFGTRLAVFFSGTAQLALFATAILVAAFFMLRQRKPNDPTAAPAPVPAPAPAPAPHQYRSLAVAHSMTMIGAFPVGVLTGLAGVGGGFLIVPVLFLIAGQPMKQAVGTSLFVIALTTFTGFVGYLGRVDVAWSFMAAFSGFAVLGVLVGAHLAQSVSAHSLKRGFAVFILVLGVVILYESLFRTAMRP